MEEMASSSNFLHLENASLHALRPLDTPVVLSLQEVTAALAFFISSLLKQVQASAAVASLALASHSAALVLKAVTVALHSSMKVEFGLRKSVVQEELYRAAESVTFLKKFHIFKM